MQEVQVLGVGLHAFGKTGDKVVGNKSVGELCRTAVDAALADAGVKWKDVQAVSAAMTTNSQAKALMNTLNLARNEAVKRGTTVSLCATTNGIDCSANSWASGWMVFVDADGDANGSGGSGSPPTAVSAMVSSQSWTYFRVCWSWSAPNRSRI